MPRTLSTWLSVCALLCGPAKIAAAEAANLADLSLEELMAVSVTSVLRKETRLQDAAAAIGVLTEKDIRRVGATNLPDALRLIPGMEVFRVNANQFALTSRGFNNQFANKLLVMVDGRSVYTPSFSGVYWIDQQPMLEDLERVEVIRGPGATLWGANAVNGVINVLSKSALDTLGHVFNATVGTDLRSRLSVRSGVELGSGIYARVYAQRSQHADFSRVGGGTAYDGWRDARAGARLDWLPATGGNRVTVTAEYFEARLRQALDVPTFQPPARMVEARLQHRNRGGHVLGRWTRTFSATSESSLQVYYDQFRHRESGESRRTFDLDGQHRFSPWEQHDLVWGFDVRYSPADMENSVGTVWHPSRSIQRLYSAFVQDEISFRDGAASVTPGVKLEHNDYTGLETQPSLRLRWTLTRRQMMWAAASRAVRTPNLFADSAQVVIGVVQPPQSPPIVSTVMPNRNLGSERVLAYEVGYRVELGARAAVDVATFYNHYRGIQGYAPKTPVLQLTPTPRIIVPLPAEDRGSGATYGAELSLNWLPTDHWRLTASYSAFEMRLVPRGVGGNQGIGKQFRLQSALDVSRAWELNATVHAWDGLKHSSSHGEVEVPAHVRCDVGVTWRPSPRWELSIWAQDFTERRRPAFPDYRSTAATEVGRSFFGSISAKF